MTTYRNGYVRGYDIILGLLVAEAILSITLCLAVASPATTNLGLGTTIGLAFAVGFQIFDNGQRPFLGRVILDSAASVVFVVAIIGYYAEGQGWMAFHLALISAISYFTASSSLILYDCRRVLMGGHEPFTRKLKMAAAEVTRTWTPRVSTTL